MNVSLEKLAVGLILTVLGVVLSYVLLSAMRNAPVPNAEPPKAEPVKPAEPKHRPWLRPRRPAQDDDLEPERIQP